MRLHLIDDIPLLHAIDEPPTLDKELGAALKMLSRTTPASIEYIPFTEVLRWWRTHDRVAADTYVLVGTRPALLRRRHPEGISAGTVLQVDVGRVLDQRGHTVQARITSPQWLTEPAVGRVCIIDDVLMSGHTAAAVIDAVKSGGQATSTTLNLLVATVPGASKITDVYPNVRIESSLLLDYRPIIDGTVIFLSDLLYGTLRGRPFLDQAGLLHPFFGTDLAQVAALRQIVERHATGPVPGDGSCSEAQVRGGHDGRM